METKIYTYDVIVIGTGAAGYNAACRIKKDSNKKVAIVTEGVNLGTSRNTGSDKQTYYKLGLSGETLDSVHAMAKNLFAPGAVDGDNALCEAALSTRSFFNLCELGVAFPHNRYGEYIGYKTDHDPFERATSAGPLTSKFMTEALEKEAKRLNVEIYDNLYAIRIIKDKNTVIGLICLDTKNNCFVLFNTPNVIMATGGPAGIYKDSVYPLRHTGSTSLAITAEASLQNVTEWQYGLASIKPRWNVSGTYMQVLPRFVSIDENGNEHEFLADYFKDQYEAMNMIFLKGYQWPFDSNKVLKGSSVIDLLVYCESVLKKRRVYLDFIHNPFGLEQIEFNKLSVEALTYLTKANALLKTPILRLEYMNSPAVELYKSKGVDIHKEYLEIALCAQHHNGGIAVNKWWESSVNGLFAVGECAGTHGISRPGGSALNAGQVGSLRASQFIMASDRTPLSLSSFQNKAQGSLTIENNFIKAVLKSNSNVDEKILEATTRMSDVGAAVRDIEKMKEVLKITTQSLLSFNDEVSIANYSSLIKAYKLRDIYITQLAVLTSMIDFALHVGRSRGSSLYYKKDGELRDGLDEMFRFLPDDGGSKNKIQEITFTPKGLICKWRDVRPIPNEDNFFENVWKKYRENKNIF